MEKSAQLQIRLTPDEKQQLRRLASKHGQSLSAFVLSRTLPAPAQPLVRLLRTLRDTDEPSFVLATLNDLLARWSGHELSTAVHSGGVSEEIAGLSPFLQNYVAAMVETAVQAKKVRPLLGHVRSTHWLNPTLPLP